METQAFRGDWDLSDEPLLDNTVAKVHVTGTIGGRRLRLVVPIH